MNRDYFNRPNQGNGRDHYSYGNTHLSPKPREAPAKAHVVLFAFAFIVTFGVTVLSL